MVPRDAALTSALGSGTVVGMPLRFPSPLAPGDRIGVTAPSSGVDDGMWPRLEVALESLRRKGFEPVVGECIHAPSHVSAPKGARADELMSMLVDPDIAAVVPPWGGETSIDLLPLLDLDLLAAVDPCWYVGFSDTTTTMLPLTLRAGWATLHGWNLMDTPYAAAPGHLHWTDVASLPTGSAFTQRASTVRRMGWDRYRGHPEVDTMTLDQPARWRGLRPEDEAATFTGRLVGGCLDVLTHLAGTPYGDVPAFASEHPADGTIVCLEVCEWGPYDVARGLHGLRLAGWFDDAAGVLLGRPAGPDTDEWTQVDAVRDALGELPCPVVLDVDFGHSQPFMSLVNGALATVTLEGDRQDIRQTLA
jgi:muramoyltetrapeptide carboxypeptidase LdcA involved in peptidoglycan recycling